MSETALKLGSAFALANGIYLALLGVVFLIYPRIYPSFSKWVAAHPVITQPLTLTYRWIGVLFITIAVAISAIAVTAYRQGQLWSWYTLLTMGLVGWFGSGIINSRFPSRISLLFVLIGIVLFLIAIIIPAKAILG